MPMYFSGKWSNSSKYGTFEYWVDTTVSSTNDNMGGHLTNRNTVFGLPQALAETLNS